MPIVKVIEIVAESEKSWENAAENYYKHAILKSGLAKGMVGIVDVFQTANYTNYAKMIVIRELC